MKGDQTILPCGEPGIDDSEIEGFTFYIGKTCMNAYGSLDCKNCTKFTK